MNKRTQHSHSPTAHTCFHSHTQKYLNSISPANSPFTTLKMQTTLLTSGKIKEQRYYNLPHAQRSIYLTQNEDALPVVSANYVIKGLGQMFKPPESTGHRLQISVKLSVTAEKQTLK